MVELDNILTTGQNEDDIPDAALGDPEASHYPVMAKLQQCAKDWDPSFLHNCTVMRMRNIAKNYKDVNRQLAKPQLFRAIFDAMVLEQQCAVCRGNCDPVAHVFIPTENPPLGWIMGEEGIHVPAYTPPPQPPGQPTDAQQQLQNLNQAAVDTDPARTRSGSPSSRLTQPSGSPDIRIQTTTAELVPGITQEGHTPQNVARAVIDGAAAASAAQSIHLPAPLPQFTTAAGTSTVAPFNFDEDIRRIQREAEAATRQRNQEALQAELLIQQQTQQQQLQLQQQAYEKKKREILAAQEAEHQAHLIRMQQIRSGATAASQAPTTPLLTTNPAFALTPASPPVATMPQLITQAQLDTLTTSVTHAHRPRSVSFAAGTNYTPLTTVSSLTPSTLPQHSPSIEAIIDQRLQQLIQKTQNPLIHNHLGGSLPQLTGEKGKTLSHKVDNPEMAARLGVFAQPTFSVDGDLENVENLSKLRKILTPGYDAIGMSIVLRTMRWPHQLLQPSVPGFMKVAHKDMSFHQLMNGTLSKILTRFAKVQLG